MDKKILSKLFVCDMMSYNTYKCTTCYFSSGINNKYRNKIYYMFLNTLKNLNLYTFYLSLKCNAWSKL